VIIYGYYVVIYIVICFEFSEILAVFLGFVKFSIQAFRETQKIVNNPTASCGALGEREPPRKITYEAAFIPPAS